MTNRNVRRVQRRIAYGIGRRGFWLQARRVPTWMECAWYHGLMHFNWELSANG